MGEVFFSPCKKNCFCLNCNDCCAHIFHYASGSFALSLKAVFTSHSLCPVHNQDYPDLFLKMESVEFVQFFNMTSELLRNTGFLNIKLNAKIRYLRIFVNICIEY